MAKQRKQKRQWTGWEEIPTNESSDKGFISRLLKDVKKKKNLKKKLNKSPVKKYRKDLNRYFSIEIQMAIK